MGDKYLILSLKWSQGSECLVWYRPDAKGYTTDLMNAGRYDVHEAAKHSDGRVTVAVLEEDAISESVPMVRNSFEMIQKFKDRAAALVGETQD